MCCTLCWRENGRVRAIAKYPAYTWVSDIDQHVDGNLRLLKSRFGSGWLLDGSHPLINTGQLLQHQEAYDRSHCSVQAYSMNGRSSFFTTAVPQPLNGKGFVFSECEELGVHQPRRCDNCSLCTKCLVRSQELSRKEKQELGQIKANMTVDEEAKKVTFHYSLLKDPYLLKDNKGQAIAIARKLEDRLIKSDTIAAYNEALKDFLDRGVLRHIPEEEIKAWDGPVNYIRHHGVEKVQSVSTKLRVVSNSSLDNCNQGFSYNDMLPKGPNGLVPLNQAIVYWRSEDQCVVWDLKKAYNSIHTFNEELHCRRLVWRWGDQDADWITYGFTRMHFGNRPAMCGLEVAKSKLADLGYTIDPEAALMIKKGYVDDGTGGGSKATVDWLIGEETWVDGEPRYSGTVAQIMSIGSLEIKCMVRNGEDRPKVIEMLGGGVLGLHWDPSSDTISFNLSVNLTNKKQKIRQGPKLTGLTMNEIDEIQLTHRMVVSQIYGIYDPLGLLSPITIKYKILLQRLSSESAKWDDKLEGDLLESARDILKEMVMASDIVFPRSFKPPDVVSDLEILGWWDGGEPASACCLYTRYLEKGNTEWTLRLIMGKARVTPSSKSDRRLRKSTPRTELRGLLILTRVVSCVLSSLMTLPARISLFGDSQCTISAVDCKDRALDTWFGNRVAEVHDRMGDWKEQQIKVDELHHWPGPKNIADIATKGKATLNDVGPDSEWLNGPVEARGPRETWPVTRDFRREVPAEELRLKVY